MSKLAGACVRAHVGDPYIHRLIPRAISNYINICWCACACLYAVEPKELPSVLFVCLYVRHSIPTSHSVILESQY